MNGVSLTAMYENHSSILCTVGSGLVSIAFTNNIIEVVLSN